MVLRTASARVMSSGVVSLRLNLLPAVRCSGTPLFSPAADPFGEPMGLPFGVALGDDENQEE